MAGLVKIQLIVKHGIKNKLNIYNALLKGVSPKTHHTRYETVFFWRIKCNILFGRTFSYACIYLITVACLQIEFLMF
jgi:hypothetical protein